MGQGTPKSGLYEYGHRCFTLGDALVLVAYTNAVDSLTADTVAADLVQPPLANGYSPITLAAEGWNGVDGSWIYTHAGFNINGDPAWAATGTWGANPVTGFAIVYGTACMGYRDLPTPWVAAAGKKIKESIQNIVGG